MKKKIKIIIVIILILLAGFSSVKIFLWYKDNKHTNKVTEEIKEEVIKKEEVIDEENNEEKEIVTIDFDKLKKKNSDTVGWIKVLNTNIDYPFVKTSNNSYYLNHSFDKKYTDAGWIFMDYRNSNDLNNKNTIIYGHARKDKTMFGTLKYTLKKDWYSKDENRFITITLPNEELTYKVFSTYHIKTEDYYITTNFKSDKEYSDFLNKLKKRSVYNYNVDLTDTESILTLSSCYNETQKIVLHAKLIERMNIE